MDITTALFSELVYDFQSERWNVFELPKLSLRQLFYFVLNFLPVSIRRLIAR